MKIAKGEHLPPEMCPFCLLPSSSLEENVAHMSLAHGLFIPEKEYLVDLCGLIIYLGEKIGVGNLCIYCAKSFTSAEGARAHMVPPNSFHCSLILDRQRSLQNPIFLIH